MNFLNENDEVLVAGLGRKGKAVGDLPGIRFKVVAVKGISLLALYKGKREKKWLIKSYFTPVNLYFLIYFSQFI